MMTTLSTPLPGGSDLATALAVLLWLVTAVLIIAGIARVVERSPDDLDPASPAGVPPARGSRPAPDRRRAPATTAPGMLDAAPGAGAQPRRRTVRLARHG